jgi:predicted glycogen debranching enzyme
MSLYRIDLQPDLPALLEREYLLTNGLGAFSSSSLCGCNTRRYHGILCAATLPPVGRIMALNRIGEIIALDGDEPRRTLEFSVNQFGDTFHPRGEQYLRRFELLDGIARFEYDVEGIAIVKEIQLAWMKNVAAVRYTVTPPAGRSFEMQLLPFVSLRDFHATRRADGIRFRVEASGSQAAVSIGDLRLRLGSDNGEFVEKHDWWYGHTYAIERERGLDFSEDLFAPGRFVVRGDRTTSVTVWAAMGDEEGFDWDAELKRRPDAMAPFREKHPGSEPSATIRRLVHAAADFIVERRMPDGGKGTTVLAGYPWFADWGRDTMISLPGLMLCTGRYDDAKNVLSLFAQYVSEGMIPNKFDDYDNHPSYNTVDASLWFIHAAYEYLKATDDRQTFEKTLKPACDAIIDGYMRGTRYHIAMDPADGLITQGDSTTQLTWMDAKCGGIAFTPREGKAVEINALWYHALMCTGRTELAAKVAESFRKAFWISPFRGLADVVKGDWRDASLRCNQIFAVSLPHSPLSSMRWWRSCVANCLPLWDFVRSRPRIPSTTVRISATRCSAMRRITTARCGPGRWGRSWRRISRSTSVSRARWTRRASGCSR